MHEPPIAISSNDFSGIRNRVTRKLSDFSGPDPVESSLSPVCFQHQPDPFQYYVQHQPYLFDLMRCVPVQPNSELAARGLVPTIAVMNYDNSSASS